MSVILYKIKDVFLLIVILVLAYFVISNGLALKKLRKEKTNKINEILSENNTIIKEKEDVIKVLFKDNRYKQIEIIKHKHLIDSLVNLKGKVQVKYIKIYKDIDNYNSDKVLNYWRKEFNKQ